jgi:putative transposase
LSTAQKVAVVTRVLPEYDLVPALSAVGLPRATWYYHRAQPRSYAERYGHLREVLETIARAHPEYGYRRTTAELRETYGYALNHKVVQRLHQLWALPLLRTLRRPRPSGIHRAITTAGSRANLIVALGAIGPFEVLYADFTAVVYAGGAQRAFLIALLDHRTKVVPGWAVGAHPTTAVALPAWARAVETLRGRGVSLVSTIVHHDRDPVFTGYAWLTRLLREDGVRVSYTVRGPQDNPEMEAFFSRFKTENRSLLLDAQTLADLAAVVDARMRYYNAERRHSQLGYRAPMIYADEHQSQP